MTVEIAIMNSNGIALAADSAVTIGNKKNVKIYNSVSKLFTFSKFEPVGIMIYGNAQMMNIPWETIIKIYREKLGSSTFNTLEQYAEDFIKFIDKNTSLFPNETQKNYIYFDLCIYLESTIKVNIDKAVQGYFKTNKKNYKLKSSLI